MRERQTFLTPGVFQIFSRKTLGTGPWRGQCSLFDSLKFVIVKIGQPGRVPFILNATEGDHLIF